MTSDQCHACLLALVALVWAILIFFGLGGRCEFSGIDALLTGAPSGAHIPLTDFKAGN